MVSMGVYMTRIIPSFSAFTALSRGRKTSRMRAKEGWRSIAVI